MHIVFSNEAPQLWSEDDQILQISRKDYYGSDLILSVQVL